VRRSRNISVKIEGVTNTSVYLNGKTNLLDFEYRGEIIKNKEHSHLEYQVRTVSRYCFRIGNETEENYVNFEAVNGRNSKLDTFRRQTK
jgi:hypothetical protein